MNTNQQTIQHVGIVGAGAMGTGIAHVSALGGMKVSLLDAREGAAQAACDQIAVRLRKRVNDGKMPADGPQTVLKVLSAFKPSVKGKHIDLSKTYTNEFVTAK